MKSHWENPSFPQELLFDCINKRKGLLMHNKVRALNFLPLVPPFLALVFLFFLSWTLDFGLGIDEMSIQSQSPVPEMRNEKKK